MGIAGQFFAFVTLIAILMVVIVAINHPNGITGVLGGFNTLLGNLKTT
jgi:hypothetical protein